MPSKVSHDWPLVPLGSLTKVKRGASPRPIQDPKWFSDEGHGWVRIGDVTASDRVLLQTTQYLSDAGRTASVEIVPGDLIMSICATIGRPLFSGIHACIHDGFVAFKEVDRSRLDPEYLYFFLQGQTRHFEAQSQPGTQRNLNSALVEKTQIPLPSLDEQRRIASVLRSVDEAIATAKSVGSQASEAFEAILADLFSRYGDASTKLDGYCVAGGLQTGPFGSQLKAEDYVDEGVPIVMPVDLTPEGMDFLGAKKAPTFKVRELARHILRPNDVLFARRGEIGRCGLYLEGNPVALCGTGCLRARLDTKKIDPVLAYFLIQSRQARDWLRARAVGATMPNLNTAIIGDLPMPDIPKVDQGAWVDALLMVEGTRRINQRTLASFQKAKFTLMADLLSGHARLPQ